MSKPILYITERPRGMFKVEMKGDGVLLYKTQKDLDRIKDYYTFVYQ